MARSRSSSDAIRIHDEQADLFRQRYEVLSVDPYRDTFVYSRKKIDEVLFETLDGTRPGTLLDIGCGTGEYVRACTDRGWTVTGIEPSQGMLAHASDLNPDATIVSGSAEALPVGEATFDAVISIEVMRYLDDVDPALAEIQRVLKPGGVSIVTYAPRYSTNLYALVNQLSGRFQVGSLSRVKQRFDSRRGLARAYSRNGFVDTAVHGRFFGPWVVLGRFAPGLCARLLRRWEPIDDRLAQIRTLRNFSNAMIVVARKGSN